MKSAAAIVFDYRPSRWLQAGLIGAVLLALLAVAASGIPAAAKAIAVVAALVCAAVELRRLRNPRVHRCAWHADGQWRLRDAAGNDHVAALLQASAHAGLIVLRLRVPVHGHVALVLLPDNCDAETRRRLRVRLSHAARDIAA
jgi:toxin CptA